MRSIAKKVRAMMNSEIELAKNNYMQKVNEFMCRDVSEDEIKNKATELFWENKEDKLSCSLSYLARDLCKYLEEKLKHNYGSAGTGLWGLVESSHKNFNSQVDKEVRDAFSFIANARNQYMHDLVEFDRTKFICHFYTARFYAERWGDWRSARESSVWLNSAKFAQRENTESTLQELTDEANYLDEEIAEIERQIAELG